MKMVGLARGLIAPIAFIVSLFDDEVAVYAVYNSAAWYDLGFLVALTSGSSGIVCISIGSPQTQ